MTENEDDFILLGFLPYPWIKVFRGIKHPQQWFQCPRLGTKNYTMEAQSDGELILAAENIPVSKSSKNCQLSSYTLRMGIF